MVHVFKEIGIVRFILVAVAMWIVRMLAVLPFLDDTGRVPSPPNNGRIPENVEYFFSTLMAVVTLATLVATCYLFSQRVEARPTTQGIAIAVGLVILISLFDIALTVVVGRPISNWLFNLVPDYSPVLFIPIAIGFIVGRREHRPIH